MEGEKQGRLGNLDKMTVPQLQELLDRQKRLLSKQRFLHTLPDGGQKVKDFAAKLQQMISQRQTACGPQNDSHHNPVAGKQQPSHDNTQTASHPVRTFQSVTHRDADGALPESERATLGQGEAADSTAALSNAIDSLVISELTAPRMTEKYSDQPRNRGNLETRFPNSYENVMKKSQTAETRKEPFKPSRSLKISDIRQLPEEYKYKSKSSTDEPSSSETVTRPRDSSTEGRKKEAAMKVQEDSAVTGPDYKFKGAKEIPLQESLVLQRQQQENLERIQTLHAAERLAERLNIKTVDYNPPSLDMQYRSNAVDVEGNIYDSDDDADEDNDAPD